MGSKIQKDVLPVWTAGSVARNLEVSFTKFKFIKLILGWKRG